MRVSLAFLSCFFLGLSVELSAGSSIGDSLTCTICKTVMQSIDDTIVDPSNEQAVEDLLNGICKSLDSELEIICQEFVAEYTDDIIEMIVGQYLDPEAFCTTISACP
eukprot:TRINITY_DN7695_c1_g1_i1.p2 TRINITY_DN7695_c1_g1~~TRINITY_DN7695_c1_g1_i1.p2  ORF type:complete len:107 (+),score=13.45 TRINITY_DN7695_c1_g1_i1:31-351(+)